MNEYAYCEDPTQDAVAKISMWVDGGGVEFNVKDAELLLDTLAAKDREIAALREDIKRALSFVQFDAAEVEKPSTHFENMRLAVVGELTAALSASPAPDPALVDRILEADARPPEATFTNSEDMMAYLDAPDPAEAMRAKCEAIAQKVGDAAEKGRLANYKRGEDEWRFAAASEAASEIEEAIAALKGNGEGP